MNNENLFDLLVELKKYALISDDIYEELSAPYQTDEFTLSTMDWEDVRKLFFPKGQKIPIFRVEPMNSANLCPTFYPTLDAIHALRRDFNQDISIQNRVLKFNTILKHVKNLVSRQVNANVEDLAFVRNTSEGNNILSNGFVRWVRDAEILLWDENHPTNNAAWKLKAKNKDSVKYFSVKQVDFNKSDEEVRKAIIKQITQKIDPAKTVMLSFSHVSNASGIQLPAAEIIKAVRAISSSIHIHVDGAMTWGSKNLNLKAMDCDSYSSSSHKWFMGPFETGLFYMKKDRCKDFRINIFGYDGKVEVPDLDDLPQDARKFELLGQRDEANIYAMGRTVETHNRINRSTYGIQERVYILQNELVKQLKRKIPAVSGYTLSFLTPESRTFSNGIVFFRIMRNNNIIDHGKLNDFLYSDEGRSQRFAVATTVKKDYLRICPHVMNLESNISDVVDKIVVYLRRN